MFIKRFLMTEADGSPGNGAAPPAPAPAEPPAQGAPVVDVEAIKAAAAQAARDAAYAELRRNGALGKDKPKANGEAVPTPAPPPDLGRLRQLDRAVARTPHAARLSDAAYSRLERAFIEEAPSDAGVWLKDYFEGLGIAPTAAPAASTAQPPARSASPVSDGGTPPVSKVSLEEADLRSLTESDRDHLIRTKGAGWYMRKLAEQDKGRLVRIR